MLPMKKFILSLITLSFAVAVQAGDVKVAKDSKDQAPCCASKTSTQTKACSADKSKVACSGTECKDKSVKQALLSPKASGEVTRKL